MLNRQVCILSIASLFCCVAVLVSFANGLAQPLRVTGEVTETANRNVVQVVPEGLVGTISLAGWSGHDSLLKLLLVLCGCVYFPNSE